jgi:hypothetical protein
MKKNNAPLLPAQGLERKGEQTSEVSLDRHFGDRGWGKNDSEEENEMLIPRIPFIQTAIGRNSSS